MECKGEIFLGLFPGEVGLVEVGDAGLFAQEAHFAELVEDGGGGGGYVACAHGHE